ncbi:endonuclease/exonuclease/phosphatase family protein [Bdellovibrio sp. NC01]|uniref:endonuclease/exonuclease/phosphatase family protein n=1 Tax=Bdellovibrio sp. NC01 TaxID=2220073 RepID=UPI0011571B9A|nr:endonuclease/exonuclease/phosphatase family protein [Bdellovibrio sp. NC01]QDK38245.1 endonuclease/exonuclease/phosphatase family protein [Bdellovibrio sp. NC01]
MKNFRSVQKLISSVFALIFFVVITGCAVGFQKDKWDLPSKAPNEISVMSFNMENLFDTVHTPGHEDYTYLPKSVKQSDPAMREGCMKANDSSYRRNECFGTDWTPEALDKKLTNISKVVLDVDGNGPDNLLIMEIESDVVLHKLNTEYLKKANYITEVIIDGPDKRGINVAFLSRFPLVGKPVLHPIPWKPKNDNDKTWMERSRRILEVTVKAPNGDPITFFVAHYPSQANPTYWRQQIAQFTVDLMKGKGPNAMVIAGGDLNITHEEEDKEHIFKDILSQGGAVSHFVGCKDCPGSHNYKKSWSFLDAQIYGKALLADGTGSYEMEPATIDVIRYNQVHLSKGKYPKRWDYDTQTGVSDHFPLYVRLKQRSEAKTPVKDEPAATEKKADKKETKSKKKK